MSGPTCLEKASISGLLKAVGNDIIVDHGIRCNIVDAMICVILSSRKK